MKKVYRISIRNASRDNKRELMYEVYTSKKRAQEMCDKLNSLDLDRQAEVVTQVK